MGIMGFSGVGYEKEELKGQKWLCSILIIGPLSYISKDCKASNICKITFNF